MKTKNLVFDLDRTLYPLSFHTQKYFDEKIVEFFKNRFSLSEEGIIQLIQESREKHGCMVVAVEKEFGITPYDYMEYVCDVDVSYLPKNPELKKLLAQIPNPKYIFTDSIKKHVHDVFGKIGIEANQFSGIYDSFDNDYSFKDNIVAYYKFFKKYGVDGSDCVMFEDNAINLATAKQAGMTTVFITETPEEKPDFANYAFSSIEESLKMFL